MRAMEGVLSWVAERTYQSLLASIGPGPQPATRRARRRLLEKLRRTIVAAGGDPIVRQSYRGHAILFPLSHSLLLYEREHSTYGRNLTQIALATHAKYPGLHAIDIGGNVGDSVLLLREAGDFPVLTIEGDPRFVAVLTANLAGVPAVTIEASFVGTDGAATMTIVQAGGTSRLVRSNEVSAGVRARPLADIVARHPQFAESKLLKLDLDGLDFAVIAASLDWIARAKPVLFLEYDPSLAADHGLDGLATFAALHSAGYSDVLVWDDHGNFLLATDTAAAGVLADLERYVGTACGLSYWDICCVHSDDRDIFQSIRSTEAARQPRPLQRGAVS